MAAAAAGPKAPTTNPTAARTDSPMNHASAHRVHEMASAIATNPTIGCPSSHPAPAPPWAGWSPPAGTREGRPTGSCWRRMVGPRSRSCKGAPVCGAWTRDDDLCERGRSETKESPGGQAGPQGSVGPTRHAHIVVWRSRVPGFLGSDGGLPCPLHVPIDPLGPPAGGRGCCPSERAVRRRPFATDRPTSRPERAGPVTDRPLASERG